MQPGCRKRSTPATAPQPSRRIQAGKKEPPMQTSTVRGRAGAGPAPTGAAGAPPRSRRPLPSQATRRWCQSSRGPPARQNLGRRREAARRAPVRRLRGRGRWCSGFSGTASCTTRWSSVRKTRPPDLLSKLGERVLLLRDPPLAKVAPLPQHADDPPACLVWIPPAAAFMAITTSLAVKGKDHNAKLPYVRFASAFSCIAPAPTVMHFIEHCAAALMWYHRRPRMQILDTTSLYLNNCVLGIALFNFGAPAEIPLLVRTLLRPPPPSTPQPASPAWCRR